MDPTERGFDLSQAADTYCWNQADVARWWRSCWRFLLSELAVTLQNHGGLTLQQLLMLEQLVQSLEVVANHEADLEDIVGCDVRADVLKEVVEGVLNLSIKRRRWNLSWWLLALLVFSVGKLERRTGGVDDIWHWEQAWILAMGCFGRPNFILVS